MAGLRVTLNTGIEAVLGEAVVEASSAGLRGQLLRDGEDGYEEARKVFHGMIDRRPALIARCAGTADAINCVNFARTHDLLVAVRGGGHIDVGDEAIDTMAAHCAHRPSPLCHVVLEHTLGGSVSRIDRDATTFNHRDVQYSFLSLGVCTDPAEAETCVRWARELWEAMQSFTTGGVYVNYLGREADEGAERIKAAYGPEKYQRLVPLKNTYDPTNLFRLNQNIQPTLTATR